MLDALSGDGYLVLGSAETLMGFGAALAPVGTARGVYAKARSLPRRRAAG